MREEFMVNVKDLSPSSQKKISVICDSCKVQYNNISFDTYHSQFIRSNSDIYTCNDCNKKFNSQFIEITCDNCGNKKVKKKSNVKQHSTHFCGVKCRSEYFSGENNKHYSRIKYPCSYCQDTLYIKKYVYEEITSGKRASVFCNRTCQGKWNSEHKVGLNHPSYSSVEKQCQLCNKAYTVVKGRKNTSKYCSPRCRQKSEINRISYNCDNCNLPCETTPFKYNRSKNHFCGHKCADAFRSERLNILKKCEICNEDFRIRKSMSHQRFCSIQCQGKWQSNELVGENANNFNSSIPVSKRIVNCYWCAKEFYIGTPYRLNKENHFCSKGCVKEWYAKEWSQQDEWKEESRVRAVKMLESGIISTDTWCQIEINSILDELEIKYQNEYNCKYVAIDNYLTDYNLMIEVMGTYWHVDNRFYDRIEYQMQVERIKNDKIKKSLIKNTYGIDILYIWENDIQNNPALCRRLILEYVSKKGVLQNYHSFNYRLVDENLQLSEQPIIPYMDWEKLDLNEIISIKDKEKHSKKQLDKWTKFNCEVCGKEKEQLTCYYIKTKSHCCSYECAYIAKRGKKINKSVKK